MGEYYSVTGSPECLAHHGILGQKWGIRRFQNKDGSLTAAGRKRYDNDTEKEKVFNFDKRKEKYEKQYRDAGYSKNDSARLAKNRIISDKVMMTAGAVALTAIAGYATYRYVQNNFDSVIKPNSMLQRVAATENKSLHDVLYVSNNRHDNLRYENLYGGQMNQGVYGKKAIGARVLKIKAGKEIKVASQKNAMKALQNIVDKDPGFLALNGVDTSSKTITKDIYKKFNEKLVTNSKNGSADKFYAELKKMGYGAILDKNDSSFGLGHYNNFAPKIVFDNSGLTVESITRAAANIEDEMAKLSNERTLEYLTIPVSAIAGTKIGASYINDYRKTKKEPKNEQ